MVAPTSEERAREGLNKLTKEEMIEIVLEITECFSTMKNINVKRFNMRTNKVLSDLVQFGIDKLKYRNKGGENGRTEPSNN